ncbi:MAG: hypothetical protein EXR81_02185 [Gammaproteobacteria bacterium]|nr:hypothetical protein [Gammaproteobacteria bacterium]
MRYLGLLLMLMVSLSDASQISPAIITTLPGLGKVAQTQYGGYVSATSTACSDRFCSQQPSLFYWFVSAQTKAAAKAPIVLWSTGGPGWSSLYGFFMETGPYAINSDLTLSLRKNAWSNFANYLLIDHPIGVGLSFGTMQQKAKNLNQEIAECYAALHHFFQLYPEYRNNPFYLSGESYEGTVLPLLAQKILIENQQHPEAKINLQGLIIISPWADPILQQSLDATYAYTHGLISYQQKVHIDRLYRRCAALIHQQQPTSVAANTACADINTAIRKFSGRETNNISWAKFPTDSIDKYVNLATVKAAIHAKPDPFSSFSAYTAKVFQQGEQNSYLRVYNDLLQQGLRVLIISGMDDAKDTNFLGVNKFIQQLTWSQKTRYEVAAKIQWHDAQTQEVLGYIKQGGGLQYVEVLNAGHMVPLDQPKISYLIKDFVNQS